MIYVFVGPKGAGKDTAAKLFIENKYATKTQALALPLKKICEEVFDIPLTILNSQDFKDKPLKEPILLTRKLIRNFIVETLKYVDPYDWPGTGVTVNKVAVNFFENRFVYSPRQILQLMGTELIREQIHPDWHCMAALNKKYLQTRGISLGMSLCVTDCRFMNEFNFLTEKGAKFFYIERPESEAMLKEATHKSELEILQVREALENSGHLVLPNEGTIEELGNLIRDLGFDKVKQRNKKAY